MPTFKLDGKTIPFEPGRHASSGPRSGRASRSRTTAGTRASASPANCRMCLVEILPKPGQRPHLLDILELDAQDGRVQARAEAEAAAGLLHRRRRGHGGPRATPARTCARRAHDVQEFLLLNHPVDCPICDQAGECTLQDYWLEYQKTAEADARRAGAQAQGRRVRPDHRLRRRALRHVHALHPLHGRGGEGPRARHARARQPERDHRGPRPPARRPLHVHDRARVPGRRAHHEGLPLQGARLVPAHGRRASARAARRAATRTSTTTRATTRPTATARATTRRSTSTGCATRGCSPTSEAHDGRVTSRRRSRASAVSLAQALDEVKALFAGVPKELRRHRLRRAALARGQLGAARARARADGHQARYWSGRADGYEDDDPHPQGQEPEHARRAGAGPAPSRLRRSSTT